jgi:hypothetical protein
MAVLPRLGLGRGKLPTERSFSVQAIPC